jgi:hypothetical protein
MRRADIGFLLILIAVCWAGVGVDAASRAKAHPKAHPKPKAAPILLHLGDTISIGGAIYTVTVGSVFVLTPQVAPVPIPIPVPVPTPIPGPAPFISGYRDGQRNPATLFSPGATVFIDGSSFGPPAGTVSVNNTLCKIYSWTDTEIAIIAPPFGSYPPGPVTLSIFCLDKRYLTTAPAFTLR